MRKTKNFKIASCCRGCWFADRPSRICRSCKHFEEANEFNDFDIEELPDEWEMIE